jgi:hypothetical protein
MLAVSPFDLANIAAAGFSAVSAVLLGAAEDRDAAGDQEHRGL